jgi:hypothetical protein
LSPTNPTITINSEPERPLPPAWALRRATGRQGRKGVEVGAKERIERLPVDQLSRIDLDDPTRSFAPGLAAMGEPCKVRRLPRPRLAQQHQRPRGRGDLLRHQRPSHEALRRGGLSRRRVEEAIVIQRQRRPVVGRAEPNPAPPADHDTEDRIRFPVTPRSDLPRW